METLDLLDLYIDRIRVANISLGGGDTVVGARLILPRELVATYKKVYGKDRVDSNEFWLDLDLKRRLKNLPSEFGWKNELSSFLDNTSRHYQSIEVNFSELEKEFGINPEKEIALEIRVINSLKCRRDIPRNLIL